jgi:hypothetical protein
LSQGCTCSVRFCRRIADTAGSCSPEDAYWFAATHGGGSSEGRGLCGGGEWGRIFREPSIVNSRRSEAHPASRLGGHSDLTVFAFSKRRKAGLAAATRGIFRLESSGLDTAEDCGGLCQFEIGSAVWREATPPANAGQCSCTAPQPSQGIAASTPRPATRAARGWP